MHKNIHLVVKKYMSLEVLVVAMHQKDCQLTSKMNLCGEGSECRVL